MTPKKMWRIHRAMSYGALFGVFILLIDINAQIREFNYINTHQSELGFSGEIFEAMWVITAIVVFSVLFSAVAIVGNAFARRHNKRQLRLATDNN